MYGSNRVDTADADAERTAFRKAEKRYKLYKSPLPVKSRARYKHQYRETDLSDVVDFDSVLRSHQNGEDIPPDIYLFHCATGFSHPVFCFHDRSGFYFIPGALNIEEQCCWIKESLTSFPQPPNRTNHTAIYGHLPDLFSAVESEKVLVSVENPIGDEQGVRCGNLQDSRYMFSEKTSYEADRGPCGKKAIPASVLLRKLRWSTLGLQFDWSRMTSLGVLHTYLKIKLITGNLVLEALCLFRQFEKRADVWTKVEANLIFVRNYDTSLPHNKIPDALCLLSKKMAAPVMPHGEEFYPEAAIVNYFGPSDMLGGHLDDMEADWNKPIVSISLGCKAIFLLGGKCREDMPVAMFLRSGDVVLMAGEARECFHGVPRIFTDEENADISSLLSKLSSKGYHSIEDYMKTSRININIRQVN